MKAITIAIAMLMIIGLVFASHPKEGENGFYTGDIVETFYLEANNQSLENCDYINNKLCLTRIGNSQLLNAVLEKKATKASSPKNTLWAIGECGTKKQRFQTFDKYLKAKGTKEASCLKIQGTKGETTKFFNIVFDSYNSDGSMQYTRTSWYQPYKN